jgi:hypothetical protein
MLEEPPTPDTMVLVVFYCTVLVNVLVFVTVPWRGRRTNTTPARTTMTMIRMGMSGLIPPLWGGRAFSLTSMREFDWGFAAGLAAEPGPFCVTIKLPL